MRNKPLLIFIGIVIVIGGLLYMARGVKDANTEVTYWKNTDIACIPGHENLSQHFHPMLQIMVDGVSEPVPANIGLTNDCMAEAHTHDATGKLHFESIEAGTTFTLADFFAVWERPIAREGFTETLTINGESFTDYSTRVLKDADQIVITYTSIAASADASSTPAL